MIAQRLGLGLEGRTKWETSYRRYFSGDPADPKAALLGTGVYCIALYADAEDHPTSLLMAFDNDGDYKNVERIKDDIGWIDHPMPGAFRYFPGKSREELTQQYNDIVASFEPARKTEEELLVKKLTDLFGDPKEVSFGGDAETREDGQRWDWSDVSFLLTCEPNKYNLLRIVPIALADNNGRSERIPRDEIGKKLSGAVEHRPNGDVIITQIPMAEQGPKGYCVPATWERVLRYTGVPGEMYTLSRIGGSGFGGGTWGANIAQRLDDTLHNYGRHTEFLSNVDKIDAIFLRHYIDNGIPVFWGVNPGGYEPALQRYSLGDRSKDWDQWKQLLDQTRAATKGKDVPVPKYGGHQVCRSSDIIPSTKEIAWSDPWGRDTTERWMTSEELPIALHRGRILHHHVVRSLTGMIYADGRNGRGGRRGDGPHHRRSRERRASCCRCSTNHRPAGDVSRAPRRRARERVHLLGAQVAADRRFFVGRVHGVEGEEGPANERVGQRRAL